MIAHGDNGRMVLALEPEALARSREPTEVMRGIVSISFSLFSDACSRPILFQPQLSGDARLSA